MRGLITLAETTVTNTQTDGEKIKWLSRIGFQLLGAVLGIGFCLRMNHYFCTWHQSNKSASCRNRPPVRSATHRPVQSSSSRGRSPPDAPRPCCTSPAGDRWDPSPSKTTSCNNITHQLPSRARVNAISVQFTHLFSLPRFFHSF